MIHSLCLALLFLVVLVDSSLAVKETMKQRTMNGVLLNQIAESGGIVALDRMISSHRMAYVTGFPEWTWEPLADKFGLDSVHVYPYFCQDKFYSHKNPALENTYIEDVRVDDDSFGKQVRLFVRVKESDLLSSHYPVTITINYRRPRKWYKSWLDKKRHYQYNRTDSVEFEQPEVCFNGYCYFEIWLKRENAENLDSVTISAIPHCADSA